MADYRIPLSPWIRNNSSAISGTGKSINASLLMDKYVAWVFDDDVLMLKPRGNREVKDMIDSQKRWNLGRLSRTSLALSRKEYTGLKEERYKAPGTVTFSLRTKTRLILNLGVESVLETSIALHRLWGFPIIPASAIKGVTRHYCKEILGMTDDELCSIFGNEPEGKEPMEGEVVFMDAWPKTFQQAGTALDQDVMTPHYSEYYRS